MISFRNFLFLSLLLPFIESTAYQRQANFYQYSPIGAVFGGVSPCSSLSCKNLDNYLKCLRSEVSPYRYYAYRPELATSPKAMTAYRKFIQTHSGCFQNFCTTICTIPRVKYHPKREMPERMASATPSFSSEAPTKKPTAPPINHIDDAEEVMAPEEDSFGTFDTEGSFDSAFSDDGFEDQIHSPTVRSARRSTLSRAHKAELTRRQSARPTSQGQVNQMPDDGDAQQKYGRFTRARKNFYKGFQKNVYRVRRGFNRANLWATKKYNARQERIKYERVQKSRQAARICKMNTPQGKQLRTLCSECLAHIPPGYTLVRACSLNDRDLSSIYKRRSIQSRRKSASRRTKSRRGPMGFAHTVSPNYSGFREASPQRQSFVAAYRPKPKRSKKDTPSSSMQRRAMAEMQGSRISTGMMAAGIEDGVDTDAQIGVDGQQGVTEMLGGGSGGDDFADVEPFWKDQR